MSLRLAFLAFLLALCMASIVRFPLSLALTLAGIKDAGLSALRVTGSIWNGRIERAAFGDRLLGDVSLGLDPEALLAGDMRLQWRLAHPGIDGEGELQRLADGGVAIAKTRLAGRLQALPTLIPLDGELRFEAGRIAFGPGTCEASAVRLWTDALARSRAHLDWQGPVLEGRAVCRDGALLLPLAGADGTSRIMLEMRLTPDLDYAADLSVTTEDIRLQRRLRLLGFTAGAGGVYRLRQTGRLTSIYDKETR